MSRTILANVEGWTPVLDHLVNEFGITTALVFGVVWRYCQMSNRICNASQDVLARRVGMTRQAFNKHLSILVKAGYLEDTTPALVNRPHVYRDTGKANLRATLAATVNDVDSSVNVVDSSVIGVDSSVNDVDANTRFKTRVRKQDKTPDTPAEAEEAPNNNPAGVSVVYAAAAAAAAGSCQLSPNVERLSAYNKIFRYAKK